MQDTSSVVVQCTLEYTEYTAFVFLFFLVSIAYTLSSISSYDYLGVYPLLHGLLKKDMKNNIHTIPVITTPLTARMCFICLIRVSLLCLGSSPKCELLLCKNKSQFYQL